MMRFFITIVCVLSFNGLFAQGNNLGNNNYDLLDGLSDMNRKVKTDNQSQARQSKLNFYLDDEWKAGVFYTKKSDAVNGYLFRYNIYTDQIELRSVVNHNDIDIVTIGSKRFIYSEYFNEDSTIDEGYFEMIVNGDCKLLIRRSIAFKGSDVHDNAYGSQASTKVVEKYYIKKQNEKAVLIDKSKDGVLSMLSDKDKFVEYYDDKLILFINEKKLIELVNFYNSI
jgi:hypothetical protein